MRANVCWVLASSVALVLTGVAPAASADETWLPLDLFGGIPTSLAYDPSQPATVYAAVADRLYKSADGGASWADSGNGLGEFGAYGVDVAPSQPSMVYVVAGFQDVYRSLDAAATWQQRHTCEDCGIGLLGEVVVDPVDPAQIYVCNIEAESVQRSPDAGTTLLGTSGLCTGQLHVSASRAVFATGNGAERARRSTDFGVTWQSIGPAPDANAKGVVTDPTNAQRVYLSASSTVVPGLFHVSDDGGSTWAPAGTGLTTRGRLVIPASEPSTIFLYADAAIWKSVDSGANFSPVVTTGLPQAGIIWRLEIDPADADNMFALFWFGEVFRSTDGGATWAVDAEGIRGGEVRTLYFDPTDPTEVYALQGDSSKAVYKSLDGGATWSRAMNGLDRAFRLWLDPQDPQRLFASSHDGFYRSTDGAASWTLLATNYLFTALVFHPSDPDTLYAGRSGSGVLRSTNGGATWTPVNSLLGNLDVLSLAIDPSNPDVVYAGTSDSLWRTNNAAAWWTEIGGFTNRIESIVLDLQNPAIVYVLHGSISTNLHLARSENSGVSFIPKTPGPGLRAITLVPGNASVLYAAGAKIWRSWTQGDLWTELTSEGLPAAPFGGNARGLALAPEPGNPGRLLLGTEGFGLFELQLESIFSDGFETGDTAAWSATVG